MKYISVLVHKIVWFIAICSFHTPANANYRCAADNSCLNCGGACPEDVVFNNFATIFQCQAICQNWNRIAPNPGRGGRTFWQCTNGRNQPCSSCINGINCREDLGGYLSSSDCSRSEECRVPLTSAPTIPPPPTEPPFPETDSPRHTDNPRFTDRFVTTEDPFVTDQAGTGEPVRSTFFYQCPLGPDNGCEECEEGANCDEGIGKYNSLAECQESDECREEPFWQCAAGPGGGCNVCNVGGIDCIPDIDVFQTDIECLQSAQCTDGAGQTKTCGANEVVGCSVCENTCDDPFDDKHNCDSICSDQCRCIADGQYARDPKSGDCKIVEDCFNF